MILEGSFLATIVKMSDKLKWVTTPNPAPTSAHDLANDLATAFRGYLLEWRSSRRWERLGPRA